MKANFKREVKRNNNKHMIRRETRENEPLLSRVVDPPGTKGGPRAGNFPGPPKNTFCPGWIHDAAAVSGSWRGAAGSRGGGAELSVGAARRSGRRRQERGGDQELTGERRRKGRYIGWGPFVPVEATTRDKRSFCPGWWLHPGQKMILGGPGKFPARGPPLVLGGSTTRDKRGPFSLVPA